MLIAMNALGLTEELHVSKKLSGRLGRVDATAHNQLSSVGVRRNCLLRKAVQLADVKGRLAQHHGL